MVHKCPICGGTIRRLDWEHRNNWLFDRKGLPFKECSQCNNILRAKPPVLYWVIFPFSFLLSLLFLQISQYLCFGYLILWGVLECVYLYFISPYAPHNGFVYTDIEKEREMWLKETGRWKKEQRTLRQENKISSEQAFAEKTYEWAYTDKLCPICNGKTEPVSIFKNSNIYFKKQCNCCGAKLIKKLSLMFFVDLILIAASFVAASSIRIFSKVTFLALSIMIIYLIVRVCVRYSSAVFAPYEKGHFINIEDAKKLWQSKKEK